MRRHSARFLILVLVLLRTVGIGQTLFMNPVKYTDRKLEVYQSYCGSADEYRFYINGVQIPEAAISPLFSVGGYYAMEIEFGLMKPGDTFRVADNCGGTPFEQIVKDDYVYVEVPAAASHTGNGIGPNDEYPPYTKLSTPVALGRCAPVTVGSHGLVSYYFFTPQTPGRFSVNAAPLTDQPSSVNPGGYDINFNGFQGTPTYVIHPDGSVEANCSVKLESNTHYSGATPLALEYVHTGSVPDGDLSFGFKAMAFRGISNGGAAIEKAALGGVMNSVWHPGTGAATYKITYDGTYYRAYVNDVLVDELRRFVEYGASSGTLSPGSAAGLDYGQQVTWSGMTSGAQWVSVLVDGVLFTRQQFSVAEDMALQPVVVDAACSGEASGQITANHTGGKAPFQFALNAGAYQNTPVFSGLPPGDHTVRVRDASGCVATRLVTVGANAPLLLSVASRTDVGCAGEATGQVHLAASGGDGDYTYSRDGSSFATSPVFSALPAGPYRFYARDASGCQVSVDDTIRTTGHIVASVATVQPASCFGYADGGLTISTAGSVFSGSAHFSVDNGATFQASPVFSSLPAGTYSIRVQDDVCSAQLSAVVPQPDPLDFYHSVASQVSCHGLSDGRIQAFQVGGGTAPYWFSRDATVFGADSVLGNLSAGFYKITVKDSKGCTKESAILEVTQPTILSLGIASKTDVACFDGTSGSVHLTGNGGTSPYTFSADSVNFQPSATLANLTAGLYRFHIQDEHNCRAAISGEILQPAALNITASLLAAVTCFGGADGQLQATASGGAGTLSYSLDGIDFVNGASFSGLTAGSYSVTVKDHNGCVTQSDAITVTQPARIVPSLTVHDVKCYGGATGSATLAATGGTGALTYALGGGAYQSTGVFPGLDAGSYEFRIKDQHNCVVDTTGTVGQPPAIGGTAQIERHLLCYNDSSGIVSVEATGGVGPYHYAVDGLTFQNQATIGTLHAGTYHVTIRDQNGCRFETAPVTLTQPAVLALEAAAQTAVNCFAGSDGTVALAASGGTIPYAYASGASAYVATPDFSGLSAGANPFTVKDANGCTKEITVQVTQPAAAYRIELAAATDLTCHGSGSGAIAIQNTGGTAPYQVSLDNAEFQTGSVFPNLEAGQYTVYGKDANNCRFAMPGITLSQPTDITVRLLSKKDVDCEYYEKGEALLGASGSNGGFTFELSGLDFKFNPIGLQTNTTGLFENLLAGDYTVTARDQTGCTKELAVAIIPKNSAIRFDVDKILPSDCHSASGSVTIRNPSGGRPPYQYSISSQNHFSAQPTFSGLLNGHYIVTVADDLCSYKQNVDLALPGGIKADYTLSPVDCSTPVANLSIDPVTGGNGGYLFSLNGAPFTAERVFNGLHPTVYSLTIRDEPQSCQTVLGIEIKEQNRADLQVVSLQNVLCHGGNSGSITVKGDNNVGPFTFALHNGTFTDNPVFTGLNAGTYRVYAQNRIGCIDSLRVSVSEPTALVSRFSTQDNLCFADSTGVIEMSGTGGTPGYRYSLDGDHYQEAVLFSGLTAKTYTGYVRDRNGCVSTGPVTLVQPDLLTLSPAYRDTVRCFGEQNGVVLLSASGGTPAYGYSSDGTDFISASEFANLPAGSYRFHVKDRNGCRAQNEITLTQPDRLAITGVEAKDPLCYQGSDGSLLVATTGGNGGNVYAVNHQAGSTDNLITGLPEAAYHVKVTDRKGCLAETDPVHLTWPEKIRTLLSTVEPLCFGDANGKLSLEVSGGTPAYRAQFDGRTAAPVNGVFDFENIGSGDFRIAVTDAHGCVENVEGFLGQPTSLEASLIVSGNHCHGDQTGRIEVVASGATPDYQYALGNALFRTSGVFGQLTAGSYTVRVRDAQGCLLTRQADVVQPTEVSLTAGIADTVRCFGEQNGVVRLTASGGTPSYVYSADGIGFSSQPNIGSLGAGNYRFWVRDSKQCETSTTLAIGQPEVLQLTLLESRDPLCAGETNGSVDLVAAGGNGGYVYWRDNAVAQASGQFTGLGGTAYTFKVEDRKGCSQAIGSVQLAWPAPLRATVSITQPVCEGDRNGQVVLTANGGVAPYQVLTTAGTPVVSADTRDWDYRGLAPGSHNFRTRDANGCMTVSLADLLPAEGFLPVLFPEPEPVCQGQEMTLVANNPGKSTRWFHNDAELSALANDQRVTVSQAGRYRLVLTNATGCVSEHAYTLVNSDQALKADFLMTVQAFEGDTITVLDISQPIPDAITWQVPAEAEIIREGNGTLAFAIPHEGEYPVTLRARKGACYNVKQRPLRIFNLDDIDQTDSLLHYQDLHLIREMNVYPNPNFGEFKVEVKLTKPADVTLSIVRSTTAAAVYHQEKKGEKEYTFDLKFSNHQQDIYIVTVQSGKSVLYRRVLILN